MRASKLTQTSTMSSLRPIKYSLNSSWQKAYNFRVKTCTPCPTKTNYTSFRWMFATSESPSLCLRSTIGSSPLCETRRPHVRTSASASPYTSCSRLSWNASRRRQTVNYSPDHSSCLWRILLATTKEYSYTCIVWFNLLSSTWVAGASSADIGKW